MDGLAAYSKKLSAVGRLVGADLVFGAEFSVPPAVDEHGDDVPLYYPTYTGNRVNIYVHDNISEATREVAGASFGIAVGWTFASHVADEPNHTARLRSFDARGDTPAYGLTTSMTWGEVKVEFASCMTGNSDGLADVSGVQFGETSISVYKFPKQVYWLSGDMLTLARHHVIPVTARADYMRVWFWCDPRDWAPGVNDYVNVIALTGADAGGAQAIGGGHG